MKINKRNEKIKKYFQTWWITSLTSGHGDPNPVIITRCILEPGFELATWPRSQWNGIFIQLYIFLVLIYSVVHIFFLLSSSFFTILITACLFTLEEKFSLCIKQIRKKPGESHKVKKSQDYIQYFSLMNLYS